jgi:alpha-tubulin suppressor-like RCC1 family protein
MRGGLLGRGDTPFDTGEEIGDDEALSSNPPVDLGGRSTQISAGCWHTCAPRDTGDVYCWGHANDGQLGYADIAPVGDDETPVRKGPIDLGGKATAIAAGDFHTCALLETGQVRCWGRGTAG